MGKKWRQLKYEDRLKIYAWLQDKTSVATIAAITSKQLHLLHFDFFSQQ